jgi:hypothetical protein
LSKRGKAIHTEKWEDLDKINAEISEHLSTDADFLDHMQTPCSVFATFESEEGHARALKYNE